MHEAQYRHLLAAGRTLVETVDTERVLERLLEIAREVTGARYAALGILDERRERLQRFLTTGIDAETHRRIGDLPHGRGVLGELIRNPRPLRLHAVGEHPRSYGFPPGHPPMGSFLGVPIVIQGQPFGNLYLTEKQDGDFDTDDEEAIVVIADWAAVAIQNARLHADVTRRHDELQRAVDTLEATTSISRALAGETDLSRVLELIAKRGRAVVDARTLLITLVTPEGVLLAAGAGEGAAEIRGRTLPPDDSVTAHVIESGGSLRYTREEGPEVVRHAHALLGIDADQALFVPLVFRQRGIGALSAIDRTVDEPYNDDHARLLQAFAVSAATAVGTAQSVGAEHRRRAIQATEAERRRWARELHDDTLQEMAALRLGLSLGSRGETVEELREAMQRAVAEMDGRIGALRALLSDLRPGTLDQLGTQSALDDLAERMRTRGLDVELTVDLDYEAGRAPTRHVPEVEDAIYRLVQEALTNVTKHSGAQAAVVVVHEREGLITITVSDDGRGFDPQHAHAGFGLLGMRERAELLDGTLDVESAAGEGTTVTIRLPARRREEQPPVADAAPDVPRGEVGATPRGPG